MAYCAEERAVLVAEIEEARTHALQEARAAIERVVGEQLGRLIGLDQLLTDVPDESTLRMLCGFAVRQPLPDDELQADAPAGDAPEACADANEKKLPLAGDTNGGSPGVTPPPAAPGNTGAQADNTATPRAGYTAGVAPPDTGRTDGK